MRYTRLPAKLQRLKILITYGLIVLVLINIIDITQIMYDIHITYNLINQISVEHGIVPRILDYSPNIKIFQTSQYYLDSNLMLVSYDGVVFQDMRNHIINLINKVIIMSLSITFMQILIYNKFVSKLKTDHLLDSNIHASEINEKYTHILADNLHHEMNTPLAIMQGNVDYINKYLQESTLQGEVKKHIENKFSSIQKSIDSIQSVLENLNNNKKIRYSIYEYDIYQILKYVSEVNKKAGNLILIDEAFKNYTLSNMSNGECMNVFTNLVKNAMEANANIIRISCKTIDANSIAIFVVDNGIGLRDKYGRTLLKNKYDIIFEPYITTKAMDHKHSFLDRLFTRTAGISTTKSRGVGLYLSKTSVEDCGGSIKLVSTSDQGTVFKIIIGVKNYCLLRKEVQHPELKLN